MTGRRPLLALLPLSGLLFACNTPQPSDDATATDDDVDTSDTGTSDTGTTGEPEPPPELILDDQNRALILHGINVQNKSKYQADRLPTIVEFDVHRMAEDWGFNVVRFLIFWDAVEPEPGVYDDLYLAEVATRLEWFEAEGIHVILDMHQDVYSEYFCCDGAPVWAIRDDGQPFEEQPLWMANYLQPAVQTAFTNFWLGDAGAHPDLQEHYVAAWQHVAETFAGTPNLLGYDLMNEPFPGTAWTFGDIDAITPSPAIVDWGATALTPFYDRVTAGIREVDQDSWIFVEPRYGAAASGRPSVLQPVTDPRADGPRVVYYPHLYPIEPDVFDTYDPNNPTIANWQSERATDQARLGGPLMLGEFGIMPAWDFGPALLEQILAMADEATTGWTYWSYDTTGRGIIDAMGAERPAAAVLTRTYARRVAGTPLEHRYDPSTREMVLRFQHHAGVTGPTEIYIPESRWYPGGWELVIDDPEGTWSSEWDAERELLLLTTDPLQSPHEVLVRPAG